MAGLAAQFVDLSGRLQLTNKATNTILQDMKNQASKADARHAELLQQLITKDQYNALDNRLAHLEQLMTTVLRDLGDRDYSSRFNQLHDTLRSSHLSLSENLQGHLLNGMFSWICVARIDMLTSFQSSPHPPPAWASSSSS